MARTAGGADAPSKRTRRKKDAVRGRLRAHDPFQLIRWLAMSQSEPRKALAELVQNSLDAQAAHVRITRVREKGTPCLRILDDGEGVVPEMERPEALRHIATHIGYSRKRDLSPEQRLELWSYEASPGCRLVRERLSVLELPYRLHNRAAGSERALPEGVARKDLPHLVDPNHSTSLSGAAAILEHLEGVYAA